MVTVAIISFTNYKRGQTTGCMGAVMRYTMQDKKTRFEDRRLVTGINCQSESVYADFMTTKRLYHKEGGTMFYHMVQSFPKDEVVDPAAAHAAALKLAEYYEGFEVLVCTHTDREHIHSHFLINSVNFDTGRKLHIAKEQLQELRQRNDQVCMEFALPVFQPRKQKQKTKTMTIGEYHTAARGQSKKLQLMNIINDCMRHASSRDEFIALMESEGYKVRWEKSRRNITYTTPSGWQCRDRLLFGGKYLKENMEYEFRIREEIIYGRTHGEEPSRAYTAKHSVQCGDPVPNAGGTGQAGASAALSGEEQLQSGRVSEAADRDARMAAHPDAGGRADESGGGAAMGSGSGWEPEREIFLSAETQTAQTTSAAPVPSVSADPRSAGGLVGDVVQLGRTLERDQYAEHVTDSTTAHHHADSKTLRKERQKKIALGHKEDDHEEEQTWQQTM